MPAALTLHGFPQPGPLKNTVLLELSKLAPVSVMVNVCPFTGGFGLVPMLPMVGATAPAETVSVVPPEVRPVTLFFTVTVKLPVAKTAWPAICVALPAALMLHGLPQPGPLKNTELLEALKFAPVKVMVNVCPFTGGFGLVPMVLIDGATAPADTVSVVPPEVRPVTLFFTVTVKLPVAKTAWPEICVLLPAALMLHGLPHPGPLKNTELLELSKFVPVSVMVNVCPFTGGFGLVVIWLIVGTCASKRSILAVELAEFPALSRTVN